MDSNMRDQSVSDLRYTITWRNPYKPRPAGLPKILCSSPFEEELTLPWIIASNWGLSAWAIGIYFEHPKPKRRMDEEKRAAMRKKRMHTRLEKTAPLFADEFEKKELEKRADYFAGKSQVNEAELNQRMDEFSGLMTPGEAIKYMLKLSTTLSIIFNQITLTVPLDFRYMDVKRKFLRVLTEIFGCCIKAERANLFATAALLLVKIFALGHFSLLSDVERRNRTMVTHHTSPNFASSALAILNPILF